VHIQSESLLKPLLDAAVAKVLSKAKKAVFKKHGTKYSVKSEIEPLIEKPGFLDGAFGLPVNKVAGGVGLRLLETTKLHITHQTGRAFGGHPLIRMEMETLKEQIKQMRCGEENKLVLAVALGANPSANKQLIDLAGLLKPRGFKELLESLGQKDDFKEVAYGKSRSNKPRRSILTSDSDSSYESDSSDE
jgi:hypothetical protein